MIRTCAWHKKHFGHGHIMGILEPLYNQSETHGICEHCLFIEQCQMDIEIKRKRFDEEWQKMRELLLG